MQISAALILYILYSIKYHLTASQNEIEICFIVIKTSSGPSVCLCVCVQQSAWLYDFMIISKVIKYALTHFVKNANIILNANSVDFCETQTIKTELMFIFNIYHFEQKSSIVLLGLFRVIIPHHTDLRPVIKTHVNEG